MSNRKYAALLEGGPIANKERLDSILEIISKDVNGLCESITKEDWYEPSKELENGIQSIIKRKFKKMAPDLEKDYEIIAGFIPRDGMYQVVVGHREKIKWDYGTYIDATMIDTSHITADSITANTIEAGRITAGTITASHIDGWMGMPGVDRQRLDSIRDVQSIRVNERYGVGVLNTGMAIARANLNTAPQWHQGNTNPYTQQLDNTVDTWRSTVLSAAGVPAGVIADV